MRVNSFAAGLTAVLLMSVSGIEADAAAKNKTQHFSSAGRKRSHVAYNRHYSSRGRGAYFVPPPPARMPSILPEMYYRKQSGGTGVTEIAAVKKPENPYARYISTPGCEAPAPVQTRKGVVTWGSGT